MKFERLLIASVSAIALAGGALDAAWNLLDLGDTGWWRTWKGDWKP